jgi:hypothetical protein
VADGDAAGADANALLDDGDGGPGVFVVDEVGGDEGLYARVLLFAEVAFVDLAVKVIGVGVVGTLRWGAGMVWSPWRASG